VEFRWASGITPAVGGSTPDRLEDSQRGQRPWEGVSIRPCSDAGEASDDAKPVAVFEVRGLQLAEAVFVGKGRGADVGPWAIPG